MPNDYVNKANISGTEYDIRDARIPTTTSGDADKYLHVNAGTGALEFAEVRGGGGTKLYKHSFSVQGRDFNVISTESEPISSTMQDTELTTLLANSLKFDYNHQLIIDCSFIGSGVNCRYVTTETHGTPPNLETVVVVNSIILNASNITNDSVVAL